MSSSAPGPGRPTSPSSLKPALSTRSCSSFSPAFSPRFRRVTLIFRSHRFWSEEELAELKGSMVLNKIGKEEADEEFETPVKAFVEEHKAVFGNPADYTAELFHLCGSWVLSRSFHVDSKEEEDKEEDEDSDDEEEEREECVLSLTYFFQY